MAKIFRPDDSTGEAVYAYICLGNANLTASEIIDYCRKQLTGYKVPKHIEFREQLPKSPVGKILRAQLRDPQPVSQQQ